MAGHLTIWPARTPDKKSGVVLLTPGLNNRPEVLDPLIRFLTTAGYDCVRAAFQFGRPLGAKTIANDWLATIAEFDQLRLAHYAGRPTYSIGFSLGAIVILGSLQNSPIAPMTRMFLIAPPLALTRLGNSLRLLTPLSDWRLRIPSLAPSTVREHGSTTLSDYTAMFSIIDELNDRELPATASRVPTEILLADGDPLVSRRGVERWVRRRRLEWRLVTLINRRVGFTRRHLIIADEALQPQTWCFLTGRILRHFRE
jgi:alpha-beta hydrolase superfamily lysophospholipase